jgi:hypothetical protein
MLSTRLAENIRMEYLIMMAVAISAGAAAVQMGRRKGRNALVWGTLAFLFFPILFVLLFVPGKRKADIAPAISACSACGGAVSVQATTCPHCGQPQSQIAVRPWYSIPVELAGTVIVFVAAAWSVWSFVWSFSQTGTLRGLPRCDSTLAKSEVNRALANAPIGKVIGISIESFDAIRSDYADDKIVRCSADVTLNNATKHKVVFSFSARDNGTYWIEAQIVDM